MWPPPFTWISWPVMKLASWLARKTYAGATSEGCPGRCSRVSLPNSATRVRVNDAGMSGVQIGPGATAFTRMPRSASDLASENVSA